MSTTMLHVNHKSMIMSGPDNIVNCFFVHCQINTARAVFHWESSLDVTEVLPRCHTCILVSGSRSVK